MITASAFAAKSSGCCRSIVTPFIDVTRGLGAVICASQPCPRRRFNMAAATNESSSLQPSKVRNEHRKSKLPLQRIAKDTRKRHVWGKRGAVGENIGSPH